MAIAMWLYDASADHSQNSKLLNDSMLKAMSKNVNSYHDLPNAILDGRPHSSNTRNPNADSSNRNRNIKSREWGNRIEFNPDFDWMYK